MIDLVPPRRKKVRLCSCVREKDIHNRGVNKTSGRSSLTLISLVVFFPCFPGSKNGSRVSEQDDRDH